MRTATSVLVIGLLAACTTDRAPEDVITEADVERIVSTLSGDDMLGRRPFTEGIDKAAELISEEYAAAGLATLEGLDSYLQQIPTYLLTTDSQTVILNGQEVPAERCIFAINEREIHWTNDGGVEVASVDADDNSLQGVGVHEAAHAEPRRCIRRLDHLHRPGDRAPREPRGLRDARRPDCARAERS